MANLQPELLAETKERGLIAGWCSQEELNHPSAGTHFGWNSLKSFVQEHRCFVGIYIYTHTHIYIYIYTCDEWGIGMELDNDIIKREALEKLVRELMEGDKSQEMKKKAMEWKKLAEASTDSDHQGSSSINFNSLVNELLLSKG
ncbi:hypothetical protein I3842_04G192000 [Carya illinoinensis]|uniref:Uncharacterized protein n=1 Tax=Carya illinoinensis TaxID=32201 RepID=A0A922JSS3_CARIL|nr:hypothetical protein I3842_04G192000 [Carya illinoinensis]